MTYNKAINFELLFTGNELLIGQVLNTNSQWLTHNITLLGGICSRITVIRDDLKDISDTIREILHRRPRYLIISGGLGPTYDDITLEGLSLALNKSLYTNKTAVSWITKKYNELQKRGIVKGLEITPARIKMAKLPLNSKPLNNPIGTAPGVFLVSGKTKIFCLPGVPKEMEEIFKESVKKEIARDLKESTFVETYFTVKGVGESTMAPLIKEVGEKHSPYVYIKSHPKHGRSKVTVDFHLTTQNNAPCYNKGKKFLKRKIREAQADLESGLKKIGGKIFY
ncbi:MAG: molybdopterin-binding protein [Candidatus Bathyarchaeota archaeon]|nr:molybdopterin-binding protein [Candidatus Bathyarchaeota archaeon]MCZ2845052.1 molybdopterin-binding protein [Candidatus Bathyarchaeota archaeon]